MKFASLFFLLFLCSCSGPELEKKVTHPNIVFVITDDQGYGDIGIHGNRNINTPHLDSLSLQSVNFSNFHSATTCAPTRSSIMTGYNANTVGVWHTILGRSFLNSSYPTLPELLTEQGYSTGIFGKWHLGDNYHYRPQDRGFQEVLIHGGGGVGQTPDVWNNDYFDDTYIHNGEHEKFKGYCTDIWFDESIKWMKKLKEDGQPFFSYISTNAPHSPFHIGDQYVEPYRSNTEIPNPNFYGMITNIDDNMGKLMDFLKDEGLDENTILIFMTDNGTSGGVTLDKEGFVTNGFNSGMRGKKASEYEGGHRVPLFMRFPKMMNIKPQTYRELTSAQDLLPTLLDFIGQTPNADGLSFRRLLETGIQPELDQRIVVVDKQRVDRPVKWKNTAVMKGDWRLINRDELYNIHEDPEQRHNIIAENNAVAEELRIRYDEWWAANEEAFSQDNYIPVGYSDETVMLTCHDWVSAKGSPWHQGHIRNAKVDNGYWNIDVAKKGKYLISFYRWPPSLHQSIDRKVPQGEDVSGGRPWPEGKALKALNAQLKIQDQDLVATQPTSEERFTFEVELNKGPSQLLTRINYEDESRGAYYVQVEYISL